MNKTIYLDNAATTPVSNVAKKAINEVLDNFYNPSANYEAAQKVKRDINNARTIIADYINAQSEEIIFTSGGSESNNMAIKGIVDAYNITTIITTEIEHPSVYNTCKYLETKGIKVHYIPVDFNGEIKYNNLNKILDNIASDEKVLASIMMVNNEVGVINQIKKLSQQFHNHGIIFHVDAVQAFTHIPIDVQDMGIDLMSVSGHKFGCPKGIGFLYIKEGLKLTPLIHGGHQEYGLRAGTENVPYIYAMAKQIENLPDILESQCKIHGLRLELSLLLTERLYDLIGTPMINRSDYLDYEAPNILSVTMDGINAKKLITLLDEKNIQISAGSACCAGENTPSRVIKAMGYSDEYALSTIRISISENITHEDIVRFVNGMVECVKMLKMLDTEVTNE